MRLCLQLFITVQKIIERVKDGHNRWILPVFGLIGDDRRRKREDIFYWTLALLVLESREVAVATGNQWTEIVIIVTRLLLRSRRD
jgi:hypothetical protein